MFKTPFHVMLRQCREQVGMTEQDVAYQIGVPLGVVTSVEMGARPIPAELLVLWGETIGTSPMFLAMHYINDLADKYCRRANLPCSFQISIQPHIEEEGRRSDHL